MIVLLEIELDRFRNYSRKRFDFSSDCVLLCGPNGSGKTNLLEAVSYLSVLRSFRGHVQSRELCACGESVFSLSALLDKGTYRERLRIVESRSGKRELKIGEAAVLRSSEFIREFRSVAFVPEDKFIVSGSSGHRRRFFDMLISTLDPLYLTALMRYSRALAQRNRAFKSNPQSVRFFEPELAEHIGVICSARHDFSRRIAAEFNRISGGKYDFAISYAPEYPEEKAAFLEHLQKMRPRETERCCTLCGPHRDEFVFSLDGRELRVFGSTGQIGIAALLVKMAEFELVRSLAKLPVVALIDDVTGDLDASNRALFLDIVRTADQRIFTFSREETIPHFDDAQRIELRA
ncbi:MAG: DNA replication/repair protein RecF [Lentisphaeria bacterium]|nr:DNA replication/repair protein RecF [Lentisphaeria bacterium]